MLHLEKITSWEFGLYDERGVLVSNTYDSISNPCGQYRLAMKGKMYVIIKVVGNTVKELVTKCISKPNLAELFQFGCVPVELGGGYALIDGAGHKLLRDRKLIHVINSSLVVTNDRVDTERYRLFNPVTLQMSKSYLDFEIYDNYIETLDEGGKGVINYEFQEELPTAYEDVFPFGMVFKGIADGKEVVGSSRWEESSKPVDKVFPEQNGFFRAFNGTRYGYFRSDTGKALTCFQFINAADFERSGVALVEEPTGKKFLDRFGKTFREGEIIT